MITVKNNWPGKTITFGNKVDFHPGITIIKDKIAFDHLKKQKVAFEGYLKTNLKGTTQKILEIVSGSLDPVAPEVNKSSKSKGKGKNKSPEQSVSNSPLANLSEDEAVSTVELTLDLASLELIAKTETRANVIKTAQDQINLVTS